MHTYPFVRWLLIIFASQKPSRQCSCRIEPHRNLHCMPGPGWSKNISLTFIQHESFGKISKTPLIDLTNAISYRDDWRMNKRTEKDTERQKQEWQKTKEWKKHTQKALTRASCGVVTQRTSCLWGHRMEPLWHPSQSEEWNVPPANGSGLECSTRK